MNYITLKLFANLPKIFGFKEKTYKFSSPTSLDQFFSFLRQENTTIDDYLAKFLKLTEKQRNNYIHITPNSDGELSHNPKDQSLLGSSITISLFPPLSGG